MHEICYEDSRMVICKKEAGDISQENAEGEGLLTALGAQLGCHLYPVHRLDRVTGGLLCLAKTQYAAAELGVQFADHTVKKDYLCVVSGTPDPENGEMTDYLYYLASMQKSFVTNRPRRGAKEARLSYRTLQSTESANGIYSLVSVRLHTGRTHQVRVQFASRRLPLLGDKKYGSREKGCTCALWSHKLTFPSGLCVECPPPDCYPWNVFSR